MKKWIALVLSVCLLLPGNLLVKAADVVSRSNAADSIEDLVSIDWDGLLGYVNKKHMTIQKPDVDVTDYIKESTNNSFNIFDYMLSRGTWQYDEEQPLSIRQATEDMDVLFMALKTTYGPYHYFGGEDVFDKAKENILEACQRQEEITSKFLTGLVIENLSFIKDGHFQINGQDLSAPFVPYFYKEHAFDKTQEGYVDLASGELVRSVEGWEDLDELFKLSIARDGSLVYYPVVLKQMPQGDPAYKPKDIVLTFNNEEQISLSASPWMSKYDESERWVDLHYTNGIPVIFSRQMGFDQAQNDGIGNMFLTYINNLKNEPIVIVDLRSNVGGNGILPAKWLEIYTGQPVTTNSIDITYLSQEDIARFLEGTENRYYNSYEDFYEVAGFEPVSDSYMKSWGQPDEFIPNEQVLIVLTSKFTSSAAEVFVDMAQNVENTIIVGENTYGVLISNAYTTIALPHSSIAIQLGCNLSILPEGYFEEFRGFEPDIWVDGDAEEMVVQLIQNLTGSNQED